MPDLPSNTDQLDEQLTAYLDGELPPGEARQVEDMLAGDDRARRRLNQLASSWDLLDQLPRAAVDENFTRTTVEMVALSTEEDIANIAATEPKKQRLRWLAAAVIALLAAGVGFVAVSVATPNNNSVLLEDLPVIVNLEVYRPVGSVDLLRKLSQANMFPTDSRPKSRGRPGGGPASDRGESRPEPSANTQAEPEKLIVVVPKTLEERRAWVESDALTAEQKLELRRNFERFSALPADEQEALRKLNSELTTAADRDELANIMRRYLEFLKWLRLAERGALEDRPADQKFNEIERLKREGEARMFGWQRLGSLMQFVRKNEAELLKRLPPTTRDALVNLKDEQPDSGNWRYYNNLAREVVRHPDVMMSLITNEDFQSLIEKLPPDSRLRQQLEDTKDVAGRVKILSQFFHSGALAQEAFSRSGRRGGRWNISPDRLKELEEKLDPKQREQLKGKSGPERTFEVMRMLNFDLRGERDFPGGSRRGPDDGPPPDGFGRERPSDGPRGGSPRRGDGFRGPRSEGQRGESQRGDRPREDRGPPREFRPHDDLDGPFPPPPDDERSPPRRQADVESR